MKLFIDENFPAQSADALRSIFATLEISTASSERLIGMQDLPLFQELNDRGFDAIVTHDKNQLKDPNEKEKLRENGLHWIGLRVQRIAGVRGIAIQTASLLASLPHVVAESPDSPCAFHVRRVGSEKGQRIKVVTL